MGVCRFLIHKSAFALLLLAGAAVLAGLLGKSIPTSFLPDEDQGYVFAGLQLPNTASLQRNDEVVRQAEEILKNTPGVKYYSSVIGFSMLSGVINTYSSFFFISFEEWSKRKKPEEKYKAIMAHLNREFAKIPGCHRLSPFRRRRFRAWALRAGSRSCSKIAPARASTSWRRTCRSSWPRRESGRSWPACSARRCCPCRRCSWMWIATRCSARASSCRMFTRPCSASWAARS